MAVESREFSIVRELARREVESRKSPFVGLTASVPSFGLVNEDEDLYEYTCDVRVGVREGWGLIRGVVIASAAIGVVTDLGLPVLVERSDSGRLTIIGRSQLRLPDVSLIAYSYESLGLGFARGTERLSGIDIDGFGYPLGNVSGEFESAETWTWTEAGWVVT